MPRPASPRLRIALFLLLGGLPAAAPAAPPDLALEHVVGSLFDPLGVENAGDGSGRLFIVRQRGDIRIWDGAALLGLPFLDLSTLVSGGSEQGLLGLAFHPDYAATGFFYVNYTDESGDTVISRFRVSAADPDLADPASELVLLRIPQFAPNHNGGQIRFGPDGYLYIGMGDGGGQNDTGNHAQSPDDLLGKMLRIDVDGDDFPQDPLANYAIPPGNPFLGGPGRDEIWALGLRNPWRFSFDRATGDLFIADVGQWVWEEVSFQPASSVGGENYGWRRMEASSCFNPAVNCNDGSLTLPILEYPHDQGEPPFNCAIIGGHRYRGAAVPVYRSLYFYGDNCSGRIWAGREGAGGVWSSDRVGVQPGLTSFGEDEAGELYLVEFDTGSLWRVPEPAPWLLQAAALLAARGLAARAHRSRTVG